MPLEFHGGIPVMITNEVVDTDSKHWHISYNWSARDYGCKTTALVLGGEEYFLILKGDHRKNLQAAIDNFDGGKTTGLGRCLAYVREHKDELHSFSDPII